MSKFKFEETRIKGLYVIEPTVYGDDRGYFMETYNRREFVEHGINVEFVQDNESYSTRGVLRGLHFQKKNPQGKLVRCISGEVFDVAVDLREGSDTYGDWYGVILSGENKKQFFVPEGFAHGFLVLSETARFCYKCTRFYDPSDEGGLAWDDPGIAIEWPAAENMKIKLSKKDQEYKTLGESKISF